MSINNEKIKESLLVRGVCASLQAMTLPMVDNLIELFKKGGIDLRKEKDLF